MTENNMVPASLMEEIRSLKESMDRITSFILELKHDYAVLEENIELSTSDGCLEYQRLRLQDGGRPTPSLTGMSPATMWSILSKGCI